MMQERKKDIKKYIYWLNTHELSKLRRRMQEKGIGLAFPEKLPCEVLKADIGYAEPHTWDIIGKYEAATWYHASKYEGKNLVASSFSLGDEYAPCLETVFEPSSFQPVEMPSRKELIQLSKDEKYLRCVPETFLKFPKEIKDFYLKVIGEITKKPPDKLAEYLYSWNAVHSNFVNPKYRAGKDFLHAPYSIADSFHISSCCIELFNLLDSKEDALLVRPCTGSLMTEVLEPDRYYFVHMAGKNINR